MKLLSITVKNLASIREAFIDFTSEPLASAGVFAITGSTGAGKSTLLDAICLALYAKTPRYDAARESGVDILDTSGQAMSQGDVKSILMDGTTSGEASVTFIGLDKELYRSSWRVRRTRDSLSGRLQSVSLLENLTTNTPYGEKQRETLARIEELVGLNFHQFTRSVLLAQGDFTAFLKADKDTKANLLEKLTGTEIYASISKEVYTRCQAATNEIQLLAAKAEAVRFLSEEELAVHREEISDLVNRLASVQNKIAETERGIHWYSQTKKFTEEKSIAAGALQKAEEILDAHSDDKARLQIVEDLQAVKPAFMRVQEIGQTLEKKSEEAALITNDIKVFEQQIEAMKSSCQVLSEKLIHKQTEQRDSRPLFDQARRLDVLLLEKKNQTAEKESDCQDALQKVEDHKQKAGVCNQEISNAEKRIEEANEWFQINDSRQLAAENFSLVSSKLKDAKIGFDLFKEGNHQLTILQNETEKTEAEFATRNAECTQAENDLARITQEIDTLKKEISDYSASDLAAARDAESARIMEITNAKSSWNQVLEFRVNKDGLEKKLQALSQELETMTAEEMRLGDRLNVAAIELRQAEKLMLQSGVQIEKLQQELEDGKECVVCGSLDHPYSKHGFPYRELADTIAKEAEEKRKLQESLSKEITRTETTILHLKNQISQISVEKITLWENAEKHEGSWLTLAKKIGVATGSPEMVSSWFAEEEKKSSDNLTNLSTAIQKGEETNRLIRQKEIEKQRLNNVCVELQKQSNVVEKNLNSLKVKAESLLHSTGKYREQYDRVIADINPYFPTGEWEKNWQTNEEIFSQKLQQFSTQWVEKKELLKQDQENLTKLTARYQEILNQLQEASLTLKSKKEIAGEFIKEVEKITAERFALFNGRNVADMEAEILKEIEELNKKLEDERHALSLKNEKLISQQAANVALVASMQECEAEQHTYTENIQKWLADYSAKHEHNLSMAEAKEYVAHSDEWLREKKNFFRQLNESVLHARTLYADKSQILEVHLSENLPTDEESELLEVLQSLQQKREEIHQRRGEIKHIMDQSERHKKEFEVFQKQLSALHEEGEKWQKLNALIGSADGKKFRRIAQEYTLDMMLVYANHHLAFLSRRYVLARVPDTLGLQITDLEMGNEVRSVHSLSGGESFLVSLALALGLASLSSEKMVVESLFIDEGFGSLDPQTLDVVLDALDRLHSQGRKVGIISHVQDLKERITTQIHVEKMNNGKSRVLITG